MFLLYYKMPNINYQISEGYFSIIERQIASILALEFANQITLGNTFLPSSVGYGQDAAINESEIPFVSVYFMKTDSDLEASNRNDYPTDYFIDVKALGRENCEKIINVVRHVLKSRYYVNLEINGVVSRTKVREYGVTFEENLRGSDGTIGGGLTFRVHINEEVKEIDSILALSEAYTTCKVNGTTKTIEFKNNLT